MAVVQQVKKLSVRLYDDDGRKRKPLEVLREIQAELQQPMIDGGTVVLNSKEVEETAVKPETEASHQKRIGGLQGESAEKDAQDERLIRGVDCVIGKSPIRISFTKREVEQHGIHDGSHAV